MTPPDQAETLKKTDAPERSGKRTGGSVPERLGPYALQGKLGAGGMGTVYRALHTRLKRIVALKVLPEGRMGNAQAIARFQQEMEAIGQLDHPNLIRATDAGEDQGYPFLVMELVEGLDLARLVQHRGPLPVADACELVRQAAVGLQSAHERGLIHRDVKPSNLLLSRAGQLKVLDLGLARVSTEAAEDERLTPSGEILGTPDYMAPEQAFDSQKVDIRADIYSLGCTLYKLLTGCAPFGGPEHTSRMKKLLAHAQEAPPPVRERRPEVPAGLAEVMDRLLAKDPRGRFATPAEVAAALEAFTAGSDLPGLIARAEGEDEVVAAEDASARAAGRVETRSFKPVTPGSAETRVARPRRGGSWRRPLLGAAGLAALALGLFALLHRPAAPPREPPPESKRKLTPRLWHSLLDRPPSDVFWRNPTGDQFRTFDKDRQELRVSTRDVALLGLGNVKHAGYRVQLGIRQARWSGGVGLFFGGQKVQSKDGPCVKVQFIELKPFHGVPPAPAFTVVRARATIRFRPNTVPLIARSGVASAPLSRRLGRDEQILEIRVTATGLSRVSWDGKDLPPLTTDAANARFTAADYTGSFGVFVSGADGVFQNARLMVFQQE